MLKSHRFLFLISLLIFFDLLTFSPLVHARSDKSVDAGAIPAQSNEGVEHVVFFVHGLGGGVETFQGFKEVLKKEYGDRVLVEHLTYPTLPVDCEREESDKVNPEDFARVMNSKITDFYFQNSKKGLVDIQTPYSLVAHSQGGLVSMIYLNTCMKHQKDGRPWCSYREGSEIYSRIARPEDTKPYQSDEFQEKLQQSIEKNSDFYNSLNSSKQRAFRRDVFFEDYPGCRAYYEDAQKLATDRLEKRDFLETWASVPNVKNLITLGSPFWGSATANRGQRMNMESVDLIQSLEQIFRLAIGSIGTTWQRALSLNRNATPEWEWTEDTQWKSPYPEGLKVYNLAGDLHEAYGEWRWNPFHLVRAKRFESDVIVGAPAARLDYIFNVENGDPDLPNFKGVTDIASEYYVTRLPHIDFPGVSWLPNITGMTTVNLDNYTEHPSYFLVKSVLDNTLNGTGFPIFSRSERQDYFAESVENFNSEIKLVTPKGYHRPFAISPSQVQVSAEFPDRFKKIEVRNPLYAVGHGANNTAIKVKHHFYQTYFHIGKMAGDFVFDPVDQVKKEDSIDEEAPLKNTLNYVFDIHGFQVKELSNYVAPSYTSYTEGRLIPYHPIPNNQIVDPKDLTSRTLAVLYEQNSPEGMAYARLIQLNERFGLSIEHKPVDKLSEEQRRRLEESDRKLGACYVGSMGLKTPERFRHQVLKSTPYYVDSVWQKDENGQFIYVDRPRMVEILPDAESLGTKGQPRKQVEGLTGTELYNKYAANKNWAFKNFRDEGAGKAERDLLDEGDVVEILGRYSVGFVDPISQTGRDCHHDEIFGAQKGSDRVDPICAKSGMSGNIDRYLVTSPKIRIADGLSEAGVQYHFSDLSNVFERENGFNKLVEDGNGGILGARWVNVRDVDIFKDQFPTQIRIAGGVARAHREEGTCLMTAEDQFHRYPGAEQVRSQFYQLK